MAHPQSTPVQLPLFRTSKACRKCGIDKPLDDFYRDRSAADGHKRICKECAACEAHVYNKEHREERYAYTRAWIAQNREPFLAWRRQYKRENPEQIKMSRARHDNANREVVLEQQKKWCIAHPDQVRLHGRVRQSRRIARERNADGYHTSADVLRIYADQKALCYYCRTPLDGRYEVDHKHPLSRGGSQWPANLACVCRPCNRRKGARTEQDFRLLLQQEETDPSQALPTGSSELTSPRTRRSVLCNRPEVSEVSR